MQTLKLFRRMLALVLTAATLLTVVPTGLTAHAADFQDPYLNQMVEWGFLRGDIEGNLRPYSNITRAEFVTIVNRAFGYTRTGDMPFTDVKSSDWYAEDVSIAYNIGYIQGTSQNTFSPNRQITREEAAAILARNLMLQAASGENTDFTDSRDISNWSRGLLTSLADYEIINGYADGTFRPQAPITRGETAILMVRAIGTPVQTAGVHSLGNVYGNVTINTSGVTLRNTVIAGNLYVTAGVAEGNVLLENVTVLGEIVVSGGGVSESGEDSVVLRNVTSPKLVLDNVKNTEVSVRLEGDGVIDVTSVRTNAFLEDNTPANSGALRIELDGEDGRSLELAGNIKDVVNLTPKSYLSLGAGQAQSITVDETATGTTLNIVAGAEVEEVNLDVAATITGDGDIGKLTVNASGSTVSMLPDEIVIRPGETATIDGEKMDSAAAAEASADPRMLAGYPKMTDLAPTTATASFSTNKKGIVYWAVTSVTDGSVTADDLINPPSYSAKILKRGSVSIGGANQAATAKISGLTAGGSYYLSAVFVDGREDRSPVKAISFTTPDNTAPNFATGYPYMSRITNISAQVTTMATKTCRLYYAVLPKGATAPTGEDFKANAVTGNLGYGALDVTKNKPYTFDVNSVPLEELADYDLYLWLTDVDGGASSAVKKLSFTTVDKTPPVFNTEPTINKVDKTSVGLYANLNEAGTLYWVVVREGEVYPKPLAGQSGPVDWTSDTAKLQVSAGMNALKSGKVTMTEGKDVSFTVSGLDNEQSYDLYYVAQDKAGNYAASIGKITIHTQDDSKPTVTQEFTKYNGTETNRPLPDSDVRLVFSEPVQSVTTNTPLVDYYDRVTKVIGQATEMDARNEMAAVLEEAIQLYINPTDGQPQLIQGATAATNKNTDDWTIDYRYAEIVLEDSKTVVIFPYDTGAINLKSGAKYYFEIAAKTISDTSQAQNVMGQTKLPEFETVFAQVNLSVGNNTETAITEAVDKNGTPVSLPDGSAPIDLYWRMDPISTQKVENSICWDMILWSNTHVEFQLFRRVSGALNGKWELVGNSSIMVSENIARAGNSLRMNLEDPKNNNPTFDQLNTLKEGTVYEYAISFTKVEGEPDRSTWSQTVTFDINVVAGSGLELPRLGADVTESKWNELVGTTLTNISLPETLTLHKPFRDQTAPHFIGDRPTFPAGDSTVRMDLMLDRMGTIYWVVAKRGDISTIGPNGEDYSPSGTDLTYYNKLAESGKNDGIDNDGTGTFNTPVATPPYNWIVDAGKYLVSEDVQSGSLTCGASVKTVAVDGLMPNQDYVVYFVIQGTSQVYSDVYCYRFSTGDVQKPALMLQELSPNVSFETTEDSDLSFVLFADTQLPTIFRQKFITYVDKELEAEFRQAAGSKAETMTVLDALMQTGTGGYSWFDLYAQPPAKPGEGTKIRDEIQQIITRGQGSGGTPGATGSTTTTANQEYKHDFTKDMDPINATNYYCIATAKNVLGGEYAFKAVANVHIPDTTPPTLFDPGAEGVKKSDGTYSGTLTLSFSEVVYWIPEDRDTSKICAVVGKNGVNEPPQIDSDGKIVPGKTSMLAHMGGNVDKLTPNAAATDSPTNTFTFSYSGVRVGYTLKLFTDGFICDRSGNSTVNTITLRYEETKTGVGGAITAGGWVIVQQ
ncbi:S-layer homology domain-containing protein [Candidatus Avoscillospira sp. LCP25S3_F1]|uniref:S-layer homology domain-containing protein n=1 Tax=Candidatus Avoscillospira sp. LCP25S3_F1 TaxID=3438825 RepID=UPI003F92BE24